MGSECPILDDVLLHSCEIKRSGVEVPKLCLSQKILDPDVNDVQDPCCKHVVMSQEIRVNSEVCLDMEEAAIDLPYQIAGNGEEDGQDVDTMAEMVFQLVDGVREVYLLLHEAADIIAVDAASAIGLLEVQGDGVRCVGHHVG